MYSYVVLNDGSPLVSWQFNYRALVLRQYIIRSPFLNYEDSELNFLNTRKMSSTVCIIIFKMCRFIVSIFNAYKRQLPSTLKCCSHNGLKPLNIGTKFRSFVSFKINLKNPWLFICLNTVTSCGILEESITSLHERFI